jgi:hypothetical protein
MQSLLPNMRRAEAARYIRETYGIPCAPATLAKYACVGGGPAYKLAGKFPILRARGPRHLGQEPLEQACTLNE